MDEIKTKATDRALADFLDEKVPDATRRKDCETLVTMMAEATQRPPVMWGPSIVGFGKYHYKYESGREGDSMIIGFSPRKSDLTLYGLATGTAPELIAKLGKHKAGKDCLYIKKLSDIDIPTLRALMERGVASKHDARVD